MASGVAAVSVELDPQKWYTVESLDSFGIGPIVRRRFRQAGFQAIKVGKILWFRGRDLCQWFETLAAEQAERSTALVAADSVDC